LTPLPVLFILAVLWAVVLVPPLLRSRRSQRSADSIVDFNYKLDVLGQTNGHLDIENVSAANQGPANPDRRLVPALRASATQRAARRRRDVVRALTASITVTVLLAAATHAPAAWALQILVDLMALAYLGLWAWLRTVEAARSETVRYMPERRVPERRAPELALRRSASS
jgi:hypothetical protein